MLARMFTHGYDVFSPPSSVAYHLYSRAYRNTFQSCVTQVTGHIPQGHTQKVVVGYLLTA